MDLRKPESHYRSLTGASGATVTFNANTGKVSLVLPFTTSRAVHPTSTREGDTLVLHGAYQGIWDKSGRNRAPAGAAEVRVNARTGELESFR